MAEGTDRTVGERRRRREAERAAALAAEATDAEIADPHTGAGEIAVEPPNRSASLRSGGPTAISRASTPSGASAAPSGIPSRRSLRERAADADAATTPAEGAQDTTAASRRPVIRTPGTAQAVRSLDATGQLTGIQPVVRPDAPDQPPFASPDASYLDGPALAARAALPLPAVPAATPGRDRAAEKPDVPQPPEWLTVSTNPGATVDDATSGLAAHRSRRDKAAPELERTPRPDNPALTAVKVAAIMLLAGVIGALLWLLGSEVFADDPAAASASATITTTPPPEESSAR